MWTVFIILAAALLAAFGAAPARADAWQSLGNQRNMLPGGRAALLGGAFTAVADDATASYYNPSGMAFATNARVEVSGQAYRTASTTYDGVIGDRPFEQKSSVIYPSYVGGMTHIGPVSLGYSFLTLDARNVYQRDAYAGVTDVTESVSDYTRTYQETSSYVWAGGAFALRLDSTFSVGTSVFYYQRDIQYSTNELILLNGGGVLSYGQTLSTLNTGMAFANGIMWRPGSFSFGLCIRNATALSDSSTLQIDEVRYIPVDEGAAGTGPTVTQIRSKYRPFNELNPPTYAIGVAWRPASFLMFAADGLLHEGVKSPYSDGHDLETTLNSSAGGELRFKVVALHGGVFTNNSMYPRPDPTKTYQPTSIDYRGYTYGASLDAGGFSAQIGAVRQSGDGEAQIRAGSSAVQKAHGRIDTYVLSGKVPL